MATKKAKPKAARGKAVKNAPLVQQPLPTASTAPLQSKRGTIETRNL
jgi:hypothetical protein